MTRTGPHRSHRASEANRVCRARDSSRYRGTEPPIPQPRAHRLGDVGGERHPADRVQTPARSATDTHRSCPWGARKPPRRRRRWQAREFLNASTRCSWRAQTTRIRKLWYWRVYRAKFSTDSVCEPLSWTSRWPCSYAQAPRRRSSSDPRFEDGQAPLRGSEPNHVSELRTVVFGVF